MDCAEGSYGQIYDHFAKKEIVDEVILKTRIVFITHIHGDHQLGILKILSERDKLFTNSEDAIAQKIFVVTPLPMIEWMQLFINDTLTFPEGVSLVQSHFINSEDSYYYQREDDWSFKYKAKPKENRVQSKVSCKSKTLE